MDIFNAKIKKHNAKYCFKNHPSFMIALIGTLIPNLYFTLVVVHLLIYQMSCYFNYGFTH